MDTPTVREEVAKVKATVTFVFEEVQSLFKLEDAEAETWLSENRKYIEERLCELGHQVIEDLGIADDLELYCETR